MTLHMIQMAPDMIGAAQWAQQNGVSGADEGYLFHALLRACFDTLAPKPFALAGKKQELPKLLAYSAHPPDELRECAKLFAEPLAMESLGLDSLRAKIMPASFAAGTRLGFEVRVRPVVRTGRGTGEHAGKERDAFLAAIRGLPKDTPVDRITVYRQWLTRALAPGADILAADPLDQRQTPVSRRGTADAGHHRPLISPRGPDVRFSGLLRVADAEAFAALLARGVGRHRAFGFGMLLLRPAG